MSCLRRVLGFRPRSLLMETKNGVTCLLWDRQGRKYLFLFYFSCISNTVSSFFVSGLRGPKAYSLWGGVVPSLSIGYEYL